MSDLSIKAKVKTTIFIVEHNPSFLVDNITRITHKEFHDSRTGKVSSCRRSKTIATVNCIGDQVFVKLKSAIKIQLFSVLLDASNNVGIAKMFPITVCIFSEKIEWIMAQCFIFSSVDGMYTKYEIRWDYCAAFGLYNTNVNILTKVGLGLRKRIFL